VAYKFLAPPSLLFWTLSKQPAELIDDLELAVMAIAATPSMRVTASQVMQGIAVRLPALSAFAVSFTGLIWNSANCLRADSLDSCPYDSDMRPRVALTGRMSKLSSLKAADCCKFNAVTDFRPLSRASGETSLG